MENRSDGFTAVEDQYAGYTVYDRDGDPGRAALATAERYNLEGQAQLALANAEQALQTIPTGTTDWLRAQDIAMVSRTEVARQKKQRD